ncbi:pentatricopeptide repeat-containing protein At2g20710, mitochondrial-like isoform X1 [Mangifera indica]|uniref:pentatricopeptide repeat-containing protein At2g20710, mitochondrial-like isoform X1 n=1 Tax=Mangifera indica TaxID=29780 RepID=UPI001CF98A35|nr:pentatricopeptide repeat-containing protein At2g20710, mitochondrial-like isoform X1 [Mangifera indica]
MQMKLVRLLTILGSVSSQISHRNVSSISSYSIATGNLRSKWRRRMSNSMNALFGRISPLGDPKVSIVPILDQWVQEGRAVDKVQLRDFIKRLRSFRRYTHALQMSMWMTDNRYIIFNEGDMAIRLDLIHKVKGIEQAENYFNNIPIQLRGIEVYTSLLNSYVNEKSLEKAEATMQKMRDLRLAKYPLAYNSLLKLYYQNENYEKLDSLMHEMEDKGIACNKVTFGIRLSAYAATCDVKGIEDTVTLIESDSSGVLEWETYFIAASGYVKAGFLDKALSMLKKVEGLITNKASSKAYDYLITQYAACGKKDEVLRLWELYKKNNKVLNRSYICVMPSILKFDDIESAEKVLQEWESQCEHYDIRIPNFLIAAYCRKGLLQKAETLINRATLKGGKPDAWTWFYIVTAYLRDSQTEKAVDTLEEALVVRGDQRKPNEESWTDSLEYLKEKGDLEGAEKIIKLLRDKDIICVGVQDRLLNNVRVGKANLDAIN